MLGLLSPVQNLMGFYSNLVSGGVSLARVWELFDVNAEVADRPGAQPVVKVRGEIEFDCVSFRHGETTVPINSRSVLNPERSAQFWDPAAPVSRRWPI